MYVDHSMVEQHIENWFLRGPRLLRAWLRDGQQKGKYLLYYKNGSRLLEGEWLKGMPHGNTLTWHPNGQKMHEAFFQAGLLHGRWHSWSHKGKLIASGSFHKGKRILWWQESQRSFFEPPASSEALLGVE